ncbi:MAG: hypothetical protein MJY62_06400, partial [Bacteroidales bacterium]|nr:hypothetical protein [Bacteroidales bacterium]
DADKEGNANCYIITEPGTYKFKAVMGNNTTAFFPDAAEASVLWETVCTVEAPAAGTVVASASYAEDYMIFAMPATITPGNAVIALNDADGKILWSWHIWVPASEITTVGGLFNTPMMDRHLGALTVSGSNGAVDPLSFGMMYQWGRKDPYVNSAVLGDSSPAAVTGVHAEKAPATITLAQSIANPTLMGHTDNGDWLTEVDGTLWLDDHKTVYDPCPAGYRVPSSSSNNFWGDLSAKTGWSFDKTLGWFTVGSPSAVFPLAGYRDDYSVESIAHNYDRALIWSSCTSDLTSKPGYGRGNDIRPGSSISFKDAPKSRCGSVRCVQE